MRRLQAIGETGISSRVRDKAMKLARAGHNADYISSVVRIPLDIAEEIVAKATEDRSTLDPELVWATDRQRMELSAPDKQLFVRLFADHSAVAHDNERTAIRERIILESTNLIRKHVAAHVATLNKRWEFDDLESTCTIAVIEEVDRLLAKNCEHSNPGSMLIDAILGTIFEPNRDYHSRPHRIYRPRGKKARHKRVESPWPRGPKSRDSDKHYTGEREPVEFGAPSPVVDDRWELLSELCDEQEMLMLELLSHGHTREYVAEALGCHVSTITKKFATICATIHAELQKCDRDM